VEGAQCAVVDSRGVQCLRVSARREGDAVRVRVNGEHRGLTLAVYDGAGVRRADVSSGQTEVVL
jgi:hypothetical protein